MASRSKRRTILAIIATDSTFTKVDLRGMPTWQGKCIHCNKKLYIGGDGEPVNAATIEHIVPRNHGGANQLANLALACARCNQEKGLRHDHKRRSDPRLSAVIERLRERRLARWRDAE